MRITAHIKHKRSDTFTPWEIRVGTYNEYYYPSLGPDDELWIFVEDEESGEVTKLHLKR